MLVYFDRFRIREVIRLRFENIDLNRKTDPVKTLKIVISSYTHVSIKKLF